jgi:hypothetical protein
VVTVSDDEEDLLDASATEGKLIGTKAHTRGDGGTAAAAGGGHVSAGSAALEGSNGVIHVAVSHTLGHGEGGPGGSVEVHEGKVSTIRAIRELAGKTNNEVLLVGELSLGDRARAIEDDGDVDRLTALATSGRVKDGGRGRTRGDGLKGELTEVSVDSTADPRVRLIPEEGSDVTSGASNAAVLGARSSVDGNGGASAGKVGLDCGIDEELTHGSVQGTGLASASATRLVDPLIEVRLVRGAVETTRRVELEDLLITTGGVEEAV